MNTHPLIWDKLLFLYRCGQLRAHFKDGWWKFDEEEIEELENLCFDLTNRFLEFKLEWEEYNQKREFNVEIVIV